MKELVPGMVKGYFVRKQAREVKIGDIVYSGNLIVVVAEINNLGHSIDLISVDGTVLSNINPRLFLNCFQKEDPAIQIAIEEKLEVLKSHRSISKGANGGLAHEIVTSDKPMCTSEEWVKRGSPHLWEIRETTGEYEYWEDVAYEIRILWAGNKIIAWNDCRKKQLSMYMLKSKEGICVFDAPTYDLPKYIWR